MLFESDLKKLCFLQLFKCYHSLTHTHKPQTTYPTTQSHNQKLQLHTHNRFTHMTMQSHQNHNHKPSKHNCNFTHFIINHKYIQTPTKLTPKSQTKPANSQLQPQPHEHLHNNNNSNNNSCSKRQTCASTSATNVTLPIYMRPYPLLVLLLCLRL